MAKITKATSRSGRKGKSGQSYNANHNTLEATRMNQPHIDQSRTRDNVYIRFDSNCKPHSSKGGNGGFNATQHEKKRYEELYGAGLEARNERYIKEGHKDRCRTISELYTDPKTAPMEILWQVGNSKCDIPTAELRKALTAAFNQTYSQLRKQYGANLIPLDCGLHMDEKVPHIHFRVALGAEDKFGNFVPNQNAALEAMGFERPDPSKPQSRYNSPLISFSDTVREMFYKACEQQGIQIDREVKSASRRQIEMLEYKCEAFRKDVEQARQEALVHREAARMAQETLVRVSGDIKSLESKIAVLERDKAVLEEKNRTLVAENANLKTENKQLRIQNNELEQQSTRLEIEISHLRSQIQKAQEEKKQAEKDRATAVEKLQKIEDYQRGLFNKHASRNIREYETMPAKEAKKSWGKVVQEARPECVVVAKDDLEKLKDQAAYKVTVDYNRDTAASIAESISNDDVIQQLKADNQKKQTEINRLNQVADKQFLEIQSHRDFLQQNGLEQAFEQQQARTHQHEHHHSRH